MNEKKCYLCQRDSDAVRDVIKAKLLTDPPNIFNLINFGKGYIYICVICKEVMQKFFVEELFPSLSPIFKNTIEQPLSQFIKFFNAFQQMNDLILADFGLSLQPIQTPNPPATMDILLDDIQAKKFMVNYIRGLNHIFSHFGFIIKKVSDTDVKIEYPTSATDPNQL